MYHPVANFVPIPMIARITAGTIAPVKSAGSIWNEKNRKNVAAKRSRNGEISAAARRAAGPETASPTRKAPIAPDTSSCWAIPATSKVVANIESSRASSDPPTSSALKCCP